VSHASLRMRDLLASVMQSFNNEIDWKNRIFDTKMDILTKIFGQCAILLNNLTKE
jgi:hypothetical protein